MFLQMIALLYAILFGAHITSIIILSTPLFFNYLLSKTKLFCIRMLYTMRVVVFVIVCFLITEYI